MQIFINSEGLYLRYCPLLIYKLAEVMPRCHAKIRF